MPEIEMSLREGRRWGGDRGGEEEVVWLKLNNVFKSNTPPFTPARPPSYWVVGFGLFFFFFFFFCFFPKGYSNTKKLYKAFGRAPRTNFFCLPSRGCDFFGTRGGGIRFGAGKKSPLPLPGRFFFCSNGGPGLGGPPGKQLGPPETSNCCRRAHVWAGGYGGKKSPFPRPPRSSLAHTPDDKQ